MASIPIPEGLLRDFQSDWADAIAKYEARLAHPRYNTADTNPEALDSEIFTPLRAKWGLPMPTHAKIVAPPKEEVFHVGDSLYRYDPTTRQAIPVVPGQAKLDDKTKAIISGLDKEIAIHAANQKAALAANDQPNFNAAQSKIDALISKKSQLLSGQPSAPDSMSPTPSFAGQAGTISFPARGGTLSLTPPMPSQFQPVSQPAAPLTPVPQSFQNPNWTATVIKPSGDTEVWTPKGRTVTPKATPYKTPADVRSAYRAKKISIDEAERILRDQFGME